MKQYTDKDQTDKLIELGFPKPQSIESIDIEFDDAFDEHTIYNMRYSIGELIEFLEHRIHRIENDRQWIVDGVRVYRVEDELIDALFETCVAIKDKEVIWPTKK